MGAILDIIAAIVLVFCIVSAAKRGFFKTMIGFCGTFVALGVALVFGDNAGAWLNVKWIGGAFEKTVADYLDSFITSSESAGSFGSQLETLFDSMPEVLQSFLERYSVTAADVQGAMASAIGDEARATAASAISAPLATAVSAAAGFVLVFAVAFIAIHVGTVVADAVMQLPVLKSLNGLMGMLLGIVQGAVIVMVLAGIITYLAPFLSSYIGGELSAEVIESTLIFKYFYKITPFKRIL